MAIDTIQTVDNFELAMPDLFGLIKACADWLVETYGASHWLDYYVADWDRVSRNQLASEQLLTISIEGQLTAMVAISTTPPWYYRFNKLLPHFQVPGKALYISTLAVHPDFQGQGLASQLLAHVEDLAKASGCNALRLDTRLGIEPIVQMYRGKGFGQVGSFFDDTDLISNPQTGETQPAEYGLFEKDLREMEG